MDFTGGMSASIDKISAQLPQMEATVAAAVQTELDGLKLLLDQAEAEAEKLLSSLVVAGQKLLGAESVAALLQDQELSIGGVTVKLGKPVV